MSHQLLDETSSKAFRAAKLRYLIIAGAMVVIVTICIALILYQQNQKNKNEKIAKEYSEINTLFYQENLQNSNSSQNTSALEQNINHAKSMALFAEFAFKHAQEPYGWQAAIRSAHYYINQGNLQVAKELFENIIPYTYKIPLIQMKARMALAGIYAEQNQQEKSLQQFDYINKMSFNQIPEQVRLFQAQILAIFGKNDEARQNLSTAQSPQAKIWLSALENLP